MFLLVRSCRRLVLAIAVVGCLVLSSAGAVRAQDPTTDPIPNPVPDSTDPTKPLTKTDPKHPGATTAPELALVAVDQTSALTSAQHDLADAKANTAQALADKAAIEQKLVDLAGQKTDAAQKLVDAGVAVDAAKQEVVAATAKVDDATKALTDRKADREKAKQAVVAARAGLRQSALASYVQGDTSSVIDILGNPDKYDRVETRRTLTKAAVNARLRLLELRVRQLADAEAAVSKATDSLDHAKSELAARRQDQADREQDQRNAQQHVVDVDQAITDTTNARDDASNKIAARLLEQKDATLGVADARVLAPVSTADFPLVALDAYWRAAHRAPCKVDWTTIAGIAYHESRHGTEGGSHLDATGHTSKPIVGIPLDGSNGTALIRDTDGGALDGDPVYDRAVGPMQFIPSTWKAVATDGDGDGKADPSDLYDAAATTAKYLCLGRTDITTTGPLAAAIRSYNNSDAYVRVVLAQAQLYLAQVKIPPVPPPAN